MIKFASLLIFFSIISQAWANDPEKCIQDTLRASLFLRVSAVQDQSLTESAEGKFGPDEIKSKLDIYNSPKISAQIVCSNSKSKSDYESFKSQKLTSVKLINKNLKASGSVSPEILNGLADEFDKKVLSKDICPLLKPKVDSGFDNICFGYDKCYQEACVDNLKKFRSLPLEAMSFQQACEKVHDSKKSLLRASEACEKEEIAKKSIKGEEIDGESAAKLNSEKEPAGSHYELGRNNTSKPLNKTNSAPSAPARIRSSGASRQ